jgi:hypothetical protein
MNKYLFQILTKRFEKNKIEVNVASFVLSFRTFSCDKWSISGHFQAGDYRIESGRIISGKSEHVRIQMIYYYFFLHQVRIQIKHRGSSSCLLPLR